VSRSAYGRSPCFTCGKIISVAGFAQYNHKMMHVRRDEMTVEDRKGIGESVLYYHPVFTITDKGRRARKARLADQLSLGEKVP
jgi:hypothetical protein